eukprot:CAMPEP_0117462988 /NCGR_PEP_ID=MMETSP0784-20121206/3339_1 /TAXON_ID=39447 /ORGANISM="" /LENGTH=178 /DNA_ID=CAMNT_0005256773 /DNA_START=122 /DNA_END=656 /DNA_ORIENTATION=+
MKRGAHAGQKVGHLPRLVPEDLRPLPRRNRHDATALELYLRGERLDRRGVPLEAILAEQVCADRRIVARFPGLRQVVDVVKEVEVTLGVDVQVGVLVHTPNATGRKQITCNQRPRAGDVLRSPKPIARGPAGADEEYCAIEMHPRRRIVTLAKGVRLQRCPGTLERPRNVDRRAHALL